MLHFSFLRQPLKSFNVHIVKQDNINKYTQLLPKNKIIQNKYFFLKITPNILSFDISSLYL